MVLFILTMAGYLNPIEATIQRPKIETSGNPTFWTCREGGKGKSPLSPIHFKPKIKSTPNLPKPSRLVTQAAAVYGVLDGGLKKGKSLFKRKSDTELKPLNKSANINSSNLSSIRHRQRVTRKPALGEKLEPLEPTRYMLNNKMDKRWLDTTEKEFNEIDRIMRNLNNEPAVKDERMLITEVWAEHLVVGNSECRQASKIKVFGDRLEYTLRDDPIHGNIPVCVSFRNMHHPILNEAKRKLTFTVRKDDNYPYYVEGDRLMITLCSDEDLSQFQIVWGSVFKRAQKV